MPARKTTNKPREGEMATPTPKPKKKRKTSRSKNGPVIVTKMLTLDDVNPGTLAKALELTGGDRSKIVPLSPTQVTFTR